MLMSPLCHMSHPPRQGKPAFQHGTTEGRPILPVAPEVFVLRKLLPASDEYDFNIHVMDFEPGQYLYVKEIHYNQHGLLLLQGQGIYRLGNNW
jgi:(S)-ureidoglycine aminohydrolase